MSSIDDFDAIAAAHPPPARSIRRTVAKIALGLWAIVLLAGGATLMAPHWYTLPKPERSDRTMAEALGALRSGSGEPLFAVHVLYSECRCSRRIFEHLLERGPMSNVEETILLVGPHGRMEASARERGWHVVTVGQEELHRRFHIVAVPLMVVLDEGDLVRHVGGYTARKQGPEIVDVQILSRLNGGSEPRELPVLGCATGAELAERLDPLRLRTSGATTSESP